MWMAFPWKNIILQLLFFFSLLMGKKIIKGVESFCFDAMNCTCICAYYYFVHADTGFLVTIMMLHYISLTLYQKRHSIRCIGQKIHKVFLNNFTCAKRSYCFFLLKLYWEKGAWPVLFEYRHLSYVFGYSNYLFLCLHCCWQACWQVHRLDRDSSGILVMGRTQLSTTVLHSIFREKTFGASNDVCNSIISSFEIVVSVIDY